MTTVTREMIGAAHDVMLAKGDFVLSASMLERIYMAMEQAAPPQQTAVNVERERQAALVPNAKVSGGGAFPPSA